MSLGIGITLGAKAIISQNIGAKDEHGAIEVAGQTLSFSVILSVVLGIIGIIACPWVIHAMDGRGVIFTDGLAYCRIVMAGIPMMYFYFAFEAVKHSEGDMMTPMLILTGSVILNAILDPIFILVFKWGVKGAAYATTLSRTVAMIISIIIILKDKHSRLYKSLKFLRPKSKTIWHIVKIGFPTAVGRVMTSLGFIFINRYVVSYGAHVMTAFVLGNRIISLVMMPAMGIGSSTTTIIGQNMGANQIDRAKEALRKTLFTALSFSIVGMLILFIFKTGILGVFTDSPAVLKSGIRLTNIVILTLPLMAIFQVMSGFFIGTKNTFLSMCVDIARLWIFRIPLILLLKNVFHMDEFAIWYPMLFSNILADTMFIIFYLSKCWQRKPKEEI
jgi:putative MATE family efflux protein